MIVRTQIYRLFNWFANNLLFLFNELNKIHDPVMRTNQFDLVYPKEVIFSVFNCIFAISANK